MEVCFGRINLSLAITCSTVVDRKYPTSFNTKVNVVNDHKPPFCWCHDEAIPDEVFTQSPDAAPQEPQDGETYEATWDELLYVMTHGEMGTKPSETPRRYEPPKTPPPQR